MRTLLTLVLSTAIAFASSSPTAAQCFPIPGTGCPGQTAVVCNTAPMIGTNFTFSCPASCSPSPAQFIIIGTPIVPTPLPSPPMCSTGCMLGCQPINVSPGPTITVAIPNNPSLVGLQLCLQCLCQVAGTICFTASQATLVIIQ
jgi:hypothetical protein